MKALLAPGSSRNKAVNADAYRFRGVARCLTSNCFSLCSIHQDATPPKNLRKHVLLLITGCSPARAAAVNSCTAGRGPQALQGSTHHPRCLARLEEQTHLPLLQGPHTVQVSTQSQRSPNRPAHPLRLEALCAHSALWALPPCMHSLCLAAADSRTTCLQRGQAHSNPNCCVTTATHAASVSCCREAAGPRQLLRCMNAPEAALMEPAAGLHIRLRLGGSSFPPILLYKVFTHRPVTGERGPWAQPAA